MITQDDVISVLKTIIYPNFKKDIISFGFVKSIVLHDRALALRVEIPSSDENVAKMLNDAISSKISALGLNLKLDLKTPDLKPKASPQAAPQAPQNIAPQIKDFIMVSSGKGGVGKSTTSVNLAISLAQSGKKVGLLDADIYGPNIPRMLGIEHKKPELDQSGSKLKPITAFGVENMSMGVLYEEGQSLIWRGPMIMRAISQMLTDILWSDLDILIIDMPPGTGDAQLTLAQVVPVSAGICVSTPQLVSLDDAARALDMFKKLHIPIAGIVENMSSYICECGRESAIFGKSRTDELGNAFDTPILAQIPLEQKIREGGDLGRPIVFYEPNSISAKIYRELAHKIIAFLANVKEQKLADNAKIQPTEYPK
ncbi:MAG: Mrp/NBP35 family ATP-binding protein [Helicobacter sp.]|nr:Mrp/NBP35 family ATP-binding protein [Helicobacter sp.]